MLRSLLAHPKTRGLDMDAPETTALRRAIIQEKPFLQQIYQDWYRLITTALPNDGDKAVLELGSGGGFLAELLPGLITSDIFHIPGVDAVIDGHDLPFAANSLKGIVMTNVLHHLPQPRAFFHEAERCIQPGGVIAMIEPWVTPWSRFIYTGLHHEPFQPDAAEWEFPQTGPLSGANGALPWIIFQRDRTRFEQEFPAWQIRHIQPFMPLRYLVSGGVSMRNLMPNWSYKAWRGLGNSLNRWENSLGMFALIVLKRSDISARIATQ
jgi:SAM-dependent methyltransferase